MALDADNKTFVMHVAIREQEKMPVHFEKQAHVKALLFYKALTKISAEYFNYSNVFLAETHRNFQKTPE